MGMGGAGVAAPVAGMALVGVAAVVAVQRGRRHQVGGKGKSASPIAVPVFHLIENV